MPKSSEIAFLRKNLLSWFDKNHREFPWRKPSVSNYELIISEVLLQRTKAETVARHYPNFFGQFPGWEALCAASVQQLEQSIKPLGLFRRRAKKLFAIAREYEKRQGRLPKTKYELQDSNWSSPYLRNAFELFVFKKHSPLLDVNMARVLERFFNAREPKEIRQNKELQELAKLVINVKGCTEINWAFLDFAALICKNREPKCLECKLSKKCRFFLSCRQLFSSNLTENNLQ